MGRLKVSEKLNLFRDQCELREFLPYKQFPQLFTKIDINLIPLDLAQPFCHAKCEIKYIEADICGIPSVASPTRMHKQVIHEMENGLLAENSEWFDKLKILIVDKELRYKLGNKAGEHVLDNYLSEQRAKQ